MFPKAAVKNDHELGDLKQQTLLSQLWRSESQHQYLWAEIQVSTRLPPAPLREEGWS